MTFSLRNMRGASVLPLEHGKVAMPRVAAMRARRSALVVQARYSYDEDEAPARRPSRPSRGWDDDSSQGPEQRRGGGGGGGRGSPNTQSWDPDFDAPSRMDRSSRDGGSREGGGRYSREGGSSGSGYGNRGAGERGGYSGERGGYGGNRGGGGGGGGAGGGYSRGPPRDYEGSGTGEERGGEERGGGYGYRGGRGGGGGGGRGYGGGSGRGYAGDRGGGGADQGERRGYGRDAISGEQMQQRMAANQAIREAANWRELAVFVEEKGSIMDAENVVAILSKLSGRSMSGGRQQGGYGGRGGYSRERDSYNNAEFARPRDEMSAAEYDRLLSTLLGWVLVLMPSFRPKHVTNSLQALAKLELWNVEVVTALTGSCVRQMGNLEPMDYSNIMIAFAKFNFSPGQEFVDAFLVGSARKLALMSPMDVAKLGLAMSKIGCAPTAAWAEAFWGVAAAKLGDMSELSVGDTLMASAYFAQSGQQPSQEWVDKVFGSFVETEAERQGRLAALMGAWNQQVDALNRLAMTAKEDAKLEAPPPKPTLIERTPPRIQVINKMLYTLSNLTHKPSPAWFAAVMDAWRRQLQYCSPSDLGNIALYLGRYLAIPAPSNLCAALVKEVVRGPNHGKHRGDDLAAIAYLLSASRYKGSEKEIDDFVYVLKQRLGECSLSSLELVYNALPSLGSGYRLNETVTEAANRYNDLAAQQQAEQQGAAVQVEEPAVAAA